MIKSTREELLQTLAVLSDLCPEMRMAQLITNLATLARGAAVGAVRDVEDEELLAAARQQMRTFRSGGRRWLNPAVRRLGCAAR